MRRVVPILGALALAYAGCATLWRTGVHPPDGGWQCAGGLVSTTAIPDDFHLRAQVRVRAVRDVDWGFALAAQKIDGRLVLVGLDAFGAKLFTIVQNGTQVDVERTFGRRLPWPPENVLRDLHRARLGAAEGEGVSIDRAAEDAGRERIAIHNAACGCQTTFVIAEDGSPRRGALKADRGGGYAAGSRRRSCSNRRALCSPCWWCAEGRYYECLCAGFSAMRCSLSAMGTVNALGSTREAVWARLASADTSRLTRLSEIVPGREILFGLVKEPLPPIPPGLARRRSRNSALALAALHEIEAEVQSTLARVGSQRVGVVLGTSTSGIAEAEAAVAAVAEAQTLPPGFDYAQVEHGSTAEFLADYLGARGPAYAVSTACSSSAKALASARSLLSLGVCDAVVAGGADSLCGLTTNGFAALQALSPDRTNPMSRNRRGLTLGEGAALFLLTREPDGIELLGVGESNEAHHMSAPDPRGQGAADAMLGALRDAELTPHAVAYVNLHGTGTPQNDAMEGLATARVFGTDVPCSSSKPLVGHTLGASGAVEAALCWLALTRIRDGRLTLPPHVFDGEIDPDLPRLHLAATGEEIDVRDCAVIASNSFGFGGSNCTLIFGRRLGC